MIVDLGYHLPLRYLTDNDPALRLIDFAQLLEHPNVPLATRQSKDPLLIPLKHDAVRFDGTPHVIVRERPDGVSLALGIPGIQVDRTDSFEQIEKHILHAIEFIEDRHYERHWGFDNCVIPFLFTKEVQEEPRHAIHPQGARHVPVPPLSDHSRLRAPAPLPAARALRSRVSIQRRRAAAPGQHPHLHQPVAARRLPRFLSQHLRRNRCRMKRSIIALAGALVSLGFLFASAVANYMFGASLGRTPWEAQLYGAVGVLAVAMNALAPFYISWSLTAKRRTTAAGIALIWALCLIYSTSSALGFAAQNREGIGRRAAGHA